MTNITEEKLTEWQALADAATPGPWFTQQTVEQGPERGSTYIIAANLCGMVGATYAQPTEIDSGDWWHIEANAAFIAAAREAIPALIAEVRRLREEKNPIEWLEMCEAYKTERDAAIARAENAEEERDEYLTDLNHFYELAVDDPGKNPPLFWKERAEKAEAARDEAVKLMSALARELGELKGKQDAMQFVGLLDEWRAKCAGLEAENARLREALEDTTGTTDGIDCQNIARDALGKDMP